MATRDEMLAKLKERAKNIATENGHALAAWEDEIGLSISSRCANNGCRARISISTSLAGTIIGTASQSSNTCPLTSE